MPVIGAATIVTLLLFSNFAIRQIAITLFIYGEEFVGGADCAFSFWGVTCAIERAQKFPLISHFSLLVIAAATLICSVLFLYRYAVAPFIIFMIGVLVFCLSFDLVFQLKVRNLPGLFSSTYNLTSFIVFFSFIFMITISAPNRQALRSFLISMLQSYLALDVAYMMYIGGQWAFPGMTSLYLMFIAFAFGSFTLHMMSVAGILRRSALPR